MNEAKPSASLSGSLLARKGGARPAMRRPNAVESEGKIEAGQDDLGWNDMGYDVNPGPETPMDHKHTRLNPLAAAVPEATPEVKKQQDRIAAQLSDGTVGGYPKAGIEGADQVSPLSIGGMWAPGDASDEVDEAEQFDKIDAEQPVALNGSALAAAEAGDISAEEEVVSPARLQQIALEEQLAAAQQQGAQDEASAPRKKRAAPGSKAKAAFTLRLDKERHLKLRLATAVSNRSAQRLVTEALDKMLEEMPQIRALAANVADKK